MNTIKQFIYGAPKAELHVHLEGTLEPELALAIARRNTIKLSFSSKEEFKKRLQFADLQEFLNLSYEVNTVLLTEQDFFDIAHAYLKRAQQNTIRRAEMFFDPQIHLNRGIDFKTVLSGIARAFQEGEKMGISSALIMCFVRDMPVEDAAKTLELALPYKKHIIAVGLDSAERGNPPEKCAAVFEKALSEGFRTVAHAGEEGPAEYIWQALEQLHVSRIDHGNACVDDPKLVEYLAKHRIPLTMCPLSNLRLRVITSLHSHPAKSLLDRGVCVTLNSDDPAYFGGYISDNMLALAEAQMLTKADLYLFLRNSFEASFISPGQKAIYIQELDTYFAAQHDWAI